MGLIPSLLSTFGPLPWLSCQVWGRGLKQMTMIWGIRAEREIVCGTSSELCTLALMG